MSNTTGRFLDSVTGYLEATAEYLKAQNPLTGRQECEGCGHCCVSGPCLVTVVAHGISFPWGIRVCPSLLWDEESSRHKCTLYPWRVLGKRLGCLVHDSKCLFPDNPWRDDIRDRTESSWTVVLAGDGPKAVEDGKDD